MRTKLLVLLLCLWSTSFVHAQFFESDGLYYEVTSSTNHEVSVKSADVKEQIIIPSKVEYNGEQYTVTRIGDYAFSSSSSLSSVILPEGLKSIGIYAFGGCVSLSSISLPKNLMDIGKDAFDGCL